jgi:hypothetical protein
MFSTARPKPPREPQALLAAALAAPMVFMSLPAAAQTTESWRFQGAVNLYLPDIGGTTAFPILPAGSGDAVVDAQTIIDNLKMAFMGSFEASNGRWGLFTDVLYMDVGNTKSGFREISIGGLPIPAGANAKVDYDLKGFGWTLAGTWHAVPDPAATLDVLAGARWLDITQTLGWDITGNVGAIPVPGRAGTSKVELSNWDGIVGVKGRLALGADRKWFVPYYLDVGAGQSKLTWQAVGGVGYSFQWGDVVGSWRYLDYQMKSGNAIQTLTFNGPSISAVFRW